MRLKDDRRLPLLIPGFAALLTAAAAAQTGQPASAVKPGTNATVANAAQAAVIDPHTQSVVAGTSFLKPKPIFPVSARTDATYTVEYVFNYAKYDYTPAVPVSVVKKADASYATPEQAFTAFYSAILTMDYDWMLKTWDGPSRKFIETTNEKQKLSSSYWISIWKQRYVGKKIEMVQRIESGLYVLILYRVTDPATGKQIEQDTVNFILEGNRWVATQSLAADPFSVTYPDLKPMKSSAVLLTIQPKAPNPNLPTDIVATPDQDKAQQVFLKEYPKGMKAGTQIVER